jgi:predicted ATPase
MEFGVLGPMTVVEREQSLPLGGPRQRAVLALLVAHSGRALTADRVVTELWGEDAGAGALASLYTHVSNLRGLIGKDRLGRDALGYRLTLRDGDLIDAHAFETDVAEARRHAGAAPAAGVEHFDRALGRWRGRPFEGLDDVPSLVAEAARLEELHTTAVMDRFDAVLQSAGTPSIDELEALCAERPLDERPWSLLMRSLYRVGRQADALRTYAEVRRLLGEELGIEPSRLLVDLEEQILLHDPALDPRPPEPPTNLPDHLTSFVGRDRERLELVELLGDHRLVTLVGPGGAGKTRLGVEVARSARSSFADGVWLVDLAPVGDPDRIGSAIAAVMRLPTASVDGALDQIATALQARSLLIVLDNCEHLQAALAGAIESLLSQIPGLKVLATSRRPVDVPGERRFVLGGLTVGAADAEPGDAERLFIDRSSAMSAAPTDEENLTAVREICRHLDGLPLAVELAAGRCDVLAPREIAALLSRRFAILVDQRQPRDIHRSLEATVGWSYGLLDANDRSAFSALGVFEGPFTVAAAAAVLGDEQVEEQVERARTTIEGLVATSLVTVVPGGTGPTRFRLLETLRDYARERMQESGVEADVVRRHDEYYLDVCAGLCDEFFGGGRVRATERIGDELAEYLVAWDRGLASDPLSVLPMAWPLGNHWLFGGDLGQGEDRLEGLLAATAGDDSQARADALVIAGFLVAYRNRMPQASAWTSEAIATYRASGDQMRLAYGLARGGHWAFALGDGPTAMAMLGESLDICDRIGYEDGKAWPTALTAQARRWSGDTDPEIRDLFLQARRRFMEMGETYGQIHADMILTSFLEFPLEERLRFATEMVTISRQSGAENLMRPIALHNLAYPVWEAGERDRAMGLNRASIRSAVATGAMIDLGLGLIQAATFAGEGGEAERAATLFGAASTHFGMAMAPFQREQAEPAEASARADIGDDRYDELFRIGAAMTSDEAAAHVLGPRH